jgi:hypothetical protein
LDNQNKKGWRNFCALNRRCDEFVNAKDFVRLKLLRVNAVEVRQFRAVNSQTLA